MAKKLLADYDVYDLVPAITYAGFVEESPWLQGASGQGGGLGSAFLSRNLNPSSFSLPYLHSGGRSFFILFKLHLLLLFCFYQKGTKDLHKTKYPPRKEKLLPPGEAAAAQRANKDGVSGTPSQGPGKQLQREVQAQIHWARA